LWQQQVAKATAAANENKEKFVFFIKLNRCGFIFFLLLSPPQQQVWQAVFGFISGCVSASTCGLEVCLEGV